MLEIQQIVNEEEDVQMKENPIARFAARAMIEAEELVRGNPGLFHTIILDDWRQVRLIFDSECSVTCHYYEACLETCYHRQLFPLDIQEATEQGPLRKTLYDLTSDKDKFLYGPERFLPCKTISRYAECFIRCILLDEEMKEPVKLEEELELVRNFLVVYTDSPLGCDEVAAAAKEQIVLAILAGAPEEQRKMIVISLTKLGWDFAKNVFV